MIEFEKPNIECLAINEDESYGKFVCEPLERGYGMTIGNSLRRILLSSLPGAAITSVKIEGVLHEFSSIPNVVEDVPEIIVNLNLFIGYTIFINVWGKTKEYGSPQFITLSYAQQDNEKSP